MHGSRTLTDGRRLSAAGLIIVTAGTLLMLAWAIFPSTAGAAPAPVLTPGNPSCRDLGLVEINGTITITGNEEEGTQQVAWSSSTPIDAVIVKGGNNANVYFYNEATSDSGLTAPINPNTDKPFGISHVSLCYDEDITTTTEPTTTSTSTSTSSTSTSSTPPPTTSTPPPSSSTTVAPTTITPPPDDSETVEPTTVAPPKGTAFTGPENVIPLGVIALTMMTTGSGLLWAGSRRGRREEDRR